MIPGAWTIFVSKGGSILASAEAVRAIAEAAVLQDDAEQRSKSRGVVLADALSLDPDPHELARKSPRSTWIKGDFFPMRFHPR
jgi:hypothetical protein